MSRPIGTEPSLRRGGDVYSSELSGAPSQMLLQAQDNDRTDTERILEESPNRRYAKVCFLASKALNLLQYFNTFSWK